MTQYIRCDCVWYVYLHDPYRCGLSSTFPSWDSQRRKNTGSTWLPGSHGTSRLHGSFTENQKKITGGISWFLIAKKMGNQQMVGEKQVFLILMRWRKTGKRWQVFSHTQQKVSAGSQPTFECLFRNGPCRRDNRSRFVYTTRHVYLVHCF